MRRSFRFFLLLCLALSAGPAGRAADTPGPEVVVDIRPVRVPREVRYSAVDAEVNMKAVEALRRLAAGPAYSINDVPKAVMVGPRLWAVLREFPELAEKPTIRITINVPVNGGMQRLEAGAIRFQEKTVLLLNALQRSIQKNRKVLIRRPNERELLYFWSIISYDIEEPVFVLVTRDARYLVDFNGSEFFHIEEVGYAGV